MSIDYKAWSDKIDAFISANKADMVKDMATVIGVRSVKEAPAGPDAPYGAGPRKALETGLEIARRIGFTTQICDGRVGWAELPGEREGHLATITHMDVVPEGEGWTGDPYTLREKDGWLIGRGIADDKGPGILCLYAAKFLKEEAGTLRYPLRVLFGSDEETGMTDIQYYLERQPQPLFAFSPDASFPICNAEKGFFCGDMCSKKLNGNIAAFAGGYASNMVPDRATCLVRGDASALASTDRITVSTEDGMVRLDAKGIGGHAAHPGGTINAIGLLVNYLLDNHLADADEKPYLELLRKLHASTDGAGLGVDCVDDIFDPLTCIGGVMKLEDGVLKQNINIRFPTTITGQKLSDDINAQCAALGGCFVAERWDEPFHIPADSAPIQALLRAYNTVTGEDAKPFSMGGGTYARHFKQAVSFGPEKQGSKLPDFVGPVHAADEGANLAEMLEALRIYILALLELQQLELEA